MTFSSLHHYLVAVGILLTSTFAIQQTNQAPKKNSKQVTNNSLTTEEFCATQHLQESALLNIEGLQQKTEEQEKAWVEFQQNKKSTALEKSLMVTLPVVFHVIHNNGAENLDDADVIAALDFLNNAFANESPYDPSTGVNTQIQFCLAQEDPIGNPTTGINHVASPLTELTIETQDVAMKDVSRWDPLRYINIWIVKEICSAAVGCGVAGYAYFPSSHGNPEDGLVVEAKWLGGSSGDAAVLSHEMGHYLGLYHTFQNGCANNDCLVDGDRVCDTPPDQSTVGPPCNIDVNSCTTDVNLSDPNNPFTTDQNDMFWNYMDYGEWDCYAAFTQGQADRMNFFINTVRFSLTGQSLCDNPCVNPMTLQVGQGDTIINAGTILTFPNNTIGATSFEWEVNGTPVSTATNLTYTFSPEGTYEVTLNAFNGDTLCDASLSITVIAFDCEGSAHVSDAAGADIVGCGNIGNPCKTIQYALDNVLCSSDTVFIHSGTYQLPAGTNPFTPIALIPENYSVTFLGVEDNGPVIIDGNNERRAFFYSYYGGACPYDLPNDGINVSNHFDFINLTVQNAFDAGVLCGSTNQTRGGGIYIFNNVGSNLTVSLQNCIFDNNQLDDPSTLNNNGRSASGAAVYIHGLVTSQNAATTSAKVYIDQCDFTSNSANQVDNGGHGGAVCLISCDTAMIRNSYFCNNSTYSLNSDDGDLNFDRNAGGALLILDQNSQFPGHQYTVESCTFIGNSATTADGATFPQQSEGGAVFLTSGDGGVNNTSATLRIGNSHFYDNTIETGIEHVDNNSGTLDLMSLGNNVFADSLAFSLGNDTTLCSGTPLFATYLPGATYEWSTGETTSNIFVETTGTYAVTVSLGACSTMDDIFVAVEVCDADCEDTWFQTIGAVGVDEGGLGIIESGDGHFYVKGYQDDKILLSKITSSGAVIWSRTLKITTKPRERLYDLFLDADGYLVGSGNSGLDNNQFEGFVFKYDPDGNTILWSSELNSQLRASTILETSPTDNYQVLGIKWFSAAPGIAEDAYVISIDRNTGLLSTVSNKAFTTGSTDGFLGGYFHNGAIYSAGVTDQNNTLSSFRGSVTKLDLAGNIIWARYNIVPLTTSARMYAPAIIVDQDSLLTVYYGDDNGTDFLTNNFYLSKSDLDGNLTWAKKYHLPAYDEFFSQEVKATVDGYLIVGYNRTAPHEIVLLKTNKNGTIQWSKKIASSDEFSMDIPAAHDQILVKNDRIYLVGKRQANGSGSGDVLLVKMDMNGNILSDCPFIDDLSVEETTYPTAFSAPISYTEYPSGISISTPANTLNSIALISAQSCIGACVEICDNGIDDDNDGLIDCFDPDCCSDQSCLAYYYNECDLDCFFSVSATTDIELEIEWESNDFGSFEWCSYNTPITGDLDGDGIPEIIGKPCPSIDVPASLPYPNLLIIDGATGLVEHMITTPAFYYVMDAPAIADVDGDGFAEIFVQASDDSANSTYAGTGPFVNGNVQRRILCYEYDGSNYVERWMSEEQIGYNDDRQAIAVSVADFNGDGIPELYCGNQILNSLTGELLVEGGENNHNGSKNQGDDPSLSQAYAVAVDALPDDFCANCSGLELVAGGMVYAVNIDPTNISNNTMTVEVTLPGAADGWTSIADLDRDGDIDAVVSTYNTTTGLLYAWDIQTPTAMYDQYLTPPSDFGYISQANIADFDGDGFVEIGICSQFNYQVLKPQGTTFEVLWSIDTDDSSGSTGSSVFDFNNDGSDEVIYRTETELLVLEGATGVIASTLPCESGTRMEYPVVVDVDADGETELLCSCDGKLSAYGSASTPWIDTRSVWNQRNYFNVNIEDDLRVPTIQQQHHLVGDSVILNNFLTMYGALQSALPDATTQIDTIICNGTDFILNLTICNIGDNTLTGETPITFYNSDPTNTNADTLLTLELGDNLFLDSCRTFVLNVPALFEMPIYVVVNDDYSLMGPYDLATDFPVTSIAECDFTNNIDSFLIPDPEPPVLDLGPDTLICDNGVLFLNAGHGFDSYEWFDGTTDSTNTVFEPGEYWVEVTSICGVQRDTIEINTEPITDIMLPPMVVLCGEDCTILEVTDWFDSYQWIPSDHLDCDTCATVTSCPPEETTYIVIGSSALGCFSIDTVTVIPIEPMFTVIDTAVCLGETFEFNGLDLPIGTMDTFAFPGQMGCTDTVVVNVTWNGGEDAPTLVIDAVACENESIIFDGVEIPANSQQTFNYQTYLGCDSVIIVAVAPLPTYETNLTETICPGDSILIFGAYQNQPGTYTMVFNSAEDCDSTVNVLLDFYPNISIGFTTLPTCPEFNDGSVSTNVTGGSGGGYTYLWSTGATTPDLTDLSVGTYTLTVTDGNNCQQSGSALVEAFQTDPEINSIDPDCFGATTGAIEIVNAETDWMFSLNNGAFQSEPLFENLMEGDYTVTTLDGNGCEITETVILNSPTPILINFEFSIIEVFVDESFTLDPVVVAPSALVFTWTPDTGFECNNTACDNPVFSGITSETTYTLTVALQGNESCFASESVTVIPKIKCDGTYALPNAFTPDGDGQNDVFKLLDQDNGLRVLSFVVYDRWGKKVYEGEGADAGWNGMYNGRPAAMDSYIYRVKLLCPDGVDERELSGDVTLIR